MNPESVDTEGGAAARLGHELRSEEDIRRAHPAAVAELIIAVRRFLVATFGPKGCYAKLADQAQPQAGTAAHKKLRKQYSHQMSIRSKYGPDWKMLVAIATVCTPSASAAAEALDGLRPLYEAASHQLAPLSSDPAREGAGLAGGLATVGGTWRPDLEQQFENLRAERDDAMRRQVELERELAAALQRQVEAAEMRANVVEASGDLKSRLVAANLRLDQLAKENTELSTSIERLKSQRDDAWQEAPKLRSERREMHERMARMIGFVEETGRVGEGSTAMMFLPASQRVELDLAPNTPPKRRALATYLASHAALAELSVEDIATKTGQPASDVEAVLSAVELPEFPLVEMISAVVGGDGGYLLQLYYAAEAQPVNRRPPWASGPASLPSASRATAQRAVGRARPLPTGPAQFGQRGDFFDETPAPSKWSAPVAYDWGPAQAPTPQPLHLVEAYPPPMGHLLPPGYAASWPPPARHSTGTGTGTDSADLPIFQATAASLRSTAAPQEPTAYHTSAHTPPDREGSAARTTPAARLAELVSPLPDRSGKPPSRHWLSRLLRRNDNVGQDDVPPSPQVAPANAPASSTLDKSGLPTRIGGSHYQSPFPWSTRGVDRNPASSPPDRAEQAKTLKAALSGFSRGRSAQRAATGIGTSAA